jgi:acetylglutamate kinase
MTVVVKLGGRVQSDPGLVRAVCELWSSAPGSLCIVHGGGDEVSTLQRQLGREPTFVNGRRVTTVDDLDLVRMVLSGSANKRLVSALGAAGIPAVGISGEDGGLLMAEPIDVEMFGRAGKPVAADTALIDGLLRSGFLPVISPVARDATSTTGEALNVNGDDAAAAIAGAMSAELWLIADVAGVLDENRKLLPSVDSAQMDSLVAAGTVNEGMHAKLEAGFSALTAGSPLVRIASIDAFADRNAGTALSLTPSMK